MIGSNHLNRHVEGQLHLVALLPLAFDGEIAICSDVAGTVDSLAVDSHYSCCRLG